MSTMPPSIYIVNAQEDTWTTLALTPTPTNETKPTPINTEEPQQFQHLSTIEIVTIITAVIFGFGLAVNIIKKGKFQDE